MQRPRVRVARAMPAAIAAAALWAALTPGRAVCAPAPAGLVSDVVFDEYSPLSSSRELLRRLVSPLAAAEVERSLAHAGDQLTAQSIELPAERFVLYVPAHAPAAGYGVLAFISPWEEAQLPPGWTAALDRHGVIFVSAARSGNAADVLGRREPLALLGAYNVMRRYPVDPQRVYVGGFSGGARIAERLALAYPDLFHGALLEAGSDPIDAGPPSPPERALLERFQESTRLVYLTGERDTLHLSMDAVSLDSMHDWCVFDVAAQVTPGTAHEIASAQAFSRGLGALAAHVRPEPARLAACRHALDARLTAQIARIQSLIDAGQDAEARKLLAQADRRYGALAAPASVALAAQLNR
jgi:Esterase PHB depolymerase